MLRGVGGEEETGGIAGTDVFDLGVAEKVVGEAACYPLALRHQAYGGWEESAQLRQKEWIVGATEYDDVYERVQAEELACVVAHEEVGSGTFVLEVFYYRDEHWGGQGCECDVGEELLDLDGVGTGVNGTSCGEQSDVAAFGECADNFGCGTNYSEYPARRCQMGQVVLLDRAERLGACGVAGEDYKVTSAAEEELDALKSVAVDGLEGEVAVRGARVIAKEDVIVEGKSPADVTQDGESSEAGVENADGTGSKRLGGYCHVSIADGWSLKIGHLQMAGSPAVRHRKAVGTRASAPGLRFVRL